MTNKSNEKILYNVYERRTELNIKTKRRVLLEKEEERISKDEH